jgi:hypothetical protein
MFTQNETSTKNNEMIGHVRHVGYQTIHDRKFTSMISIMLYHCTCISV